MNYKHTQIGYLTIVLFFAIALFFGIILIQIGFILPIIIFMALILLILASFISLQVTINKDYLNIKFGKGIFQKKILLKEVISAKRVKNHCYYGWGIKLWLWPKMWIYNVSGFDAVEIKTKNNKIYRIGTDEPEKLKQAILRSIK